MQASISPAPEALTTPAERSLLVVEFVSSAAANFLQTGIFFYTRHRFNWSLRSNFLLAATQGAFYVVGAMNANRLTRFWTRRQALARTYAAMAAVGLIGAMLPYSLALAILLPIYSAIAAMSWPILESLVSEGHESGALSRQIAIYNVVWSAAGAIVLALNGTIIEHFAGGVFAIPAVFHGFAMLLMFNSSGVDADAGSDVTHAPAPPVDVEPELLRLRTTALWLSRVALPATYVLIYSLMALMPSLPVLRPLDTAHQTLAGSTWMVSRLLTFVVLGMTVWWHARPRLLVLAAGLMLLAFVGTVLRPSDLFGHGTQFNDLMWMLISQLLLGVVIGLIYAASLYFGMVLSDGSTEHGGYHEALIGLGSILGPGAGVIAQTLRPGDVRVGIVAVGSVVAVSVLAVGVTALALRCRRQRNMGAE